MPRPRNPRREALGILAGIKRTASAIATRWNVESKVYGQEAMDETGHPSIPRQRRPEEYPENSAQEWKILWAYADTMEENAAALKAMALAKWQAIEGTNHTLERVR